MTGRAPRRGLGARLKDFWRGPWWWLVPLALLVGPALAVLLVHLLARGGAAPFTYTAF